MILSNKESKVATETFRMNEAEIKKLNKFKKKHHEHCRSALTTMFTETGIGCKVEVYCPACKKKKDISDYSVW